MNAQQVFYLSDHQLRAYFFNGRDKVPCETFPATPEGQADFAAYLAHQPRYVAHVLLDSRQEEYRLEIVPHLAATHRHDMMQLRAKRLFLNTPYTHSVFHTRLPNSPSGQAQDQVLFLGITEPQWLAPWLRIILARQIPLTGIYSLPLLGEALLPLLPPAPYALVVGHTAHMGEGYALRQSFFARQKFTLSRLTPLAGLDEASYAATVSQEVVNTQRYLHTLNLLPDGQPLQVLLLAPANTAFLHEYFRAQNTAVEINYQLLDPAQLARAVGMREFPAPYEWNWLVACQLATQWRRARRRQGNHYGQWIEIRYFLYLRARQALYAAAAAVLAVTGALGTAQMLSARAIVADTARMSAQMADLSARYNDAQQLQQIPFKVIHIKNTVDTARHILRQRIAPRPALDLVSHHLSQFPQLALSRMEWGVQEQTKPATVVQNEAADATPINPRFAQLRKNTAATTLEVLHHVRLLGRVEPFSGDFTQALAVVQNFIHQLRAVPGVRTVTAEKLPLTIHPEATIGNQASLDNSELGRAPFILDILIDDKSLVSAYGGVPAH